MNTIKSISKFITTYNRTTLYDDTIEENKRMHSYLAYDDKGNLCLDKTYDSEGLCENICKRIYNQDNLVVEEHFIDAQNDEVYELRKNKYDEKGLLIEAKVQYTEEVIVERYYYNDENKLIKKEITYADGYHFTENEYVWNNGLLLEELEYDDEDSLSLRKKYTYNDNKQLIASELEEISQNNKMLETYEYNDFGLTKQTTYNFKKDVIATHLFSYNSNGLLSERRIETPTQFIKNIFEYNENELPIKESRLNKDDLVLTVKEIHYNQNNEEIETSIYSRNIVENTDELILIEKHSTEYEYF
ncbi:MAG TPA: hypothetical protein PLL02_02540 [Bacteroidales bacterium]|jgi:hypothetical protein|nr:hypothetical protein [Bacteroidales bacterium]